MPGGNGGLKQKSYWGDTAAMPAIASEPLPSRADVVVVGGGITGDRKSVV